MNTLRAMAVVGLIALALPARAADPFYIGGWKFTEGVLAPWASPAQKPYLEERTRLMGKVVTIKAKGIAGPSPFPCKDAHYALKDYPPDMVFQGAFGEMHERDKSVDPAKITASLGFKSAAIKTLETGCEMDFHFVDETTAEVGLNNMVYTLKKQPR